MASAEPETRLRACETLRSIGTLANPLSSQLVDAVLAWDELPDSMVDVLGIVARTDPTVVERGLCKAWA